MTLVSANVKAGGSLILHLLRIWPLLRSCNLLLTVPVALWACAAGKPIEGGLSSPPDLVALHLLPETVVLGPNETATFQVVGELADGSQTGVTATLIATGGTISSSGRYRAGSVLGSFVAIATLGDKADTSNIEITQFTSRRLVGVVLSPSSVALADGMTQQFTATGLLSDGSDSTVSLTWTASGGTVDPTGLYTAPSQQGNYRVIASSGTFADTATVSVTVLPPNLAALVLTPASANLQYGQTQQFVAQGQLIDGTLTPVAATFTATGGTVSGTGTYTAGTTAGTFRVIARLPNGMADTSAITLTAPTVVALSLSPSTVALQTGQTQQFAVQATLSNGGTQTNPPVVWTPAGGSITSGGLFTVGNTPGTYLLIVTADKGAADTAVLTVTQAVVTSLSISPGSATIATNQTQQFSATAILSNGGAQPSPQVNWSASNGSISATGLYTPPSTTGTYQVTVATSDGGVTRSAQVVVTDPVPPSMYYNSSEPGCDGSDPNVLLCDDFEDGTWYEKNCDQANASGGLLQTDGWCGTIYGDPISPAGAATCGSAGAAGTNCAANGGLHDGSTGGVNMADHNLGPNGNGYNEIWLRYYIKALPGYVYGAQKMITINATSAGSGGISIGGSGSPFGDGAYDTCPVYDCNTTGEIYYYRQNQSQVLKLSQILGHWAYVEMHIKLNTPGQKDGIWELWINDCGTTGVCTGTPTLRSHYTTVEWQGPTDNKQIRSLWFENWANPGSVGTELYDQIKVSKGGQIGFAP
jgi:hypothetical protein